MQGGNSMFITRNKSKKEKNDIVAKDAKWGFRENKIEIPVFSEFGIEILFCGYRKNRFKEIEFIFKIINNTEHDIMLQCDGIAVNHKMIGHIMSSNVFSYSYGYAKCTITENLSDIKLDESVIRCKLALVNDFLDSGYGRYNIDFFLDLKEEPDNCIHADFDVKETQEYKALLEEKNRLSEKCTLLEKQIEQKPRKSSNKKKRNRR